MLKWIRRVRKAIRERDDYCFGERGTFWGRFTICSWRWSIAIHKFDDEPRWVLHLFCLWITLRRASTPPRDEMMDTWGFSLQTDTWSLHLNWGHRYKIFEMPWALEYVGLEAGCGPDGRRMVSLEKAGRWPKWVSGYHRLYRRASGKMTRGFTKVDVKSAESVQSHLESHRPTEPDDRYRVTLPYAYVLKSGMIQHCLATVTVERRTWCWKLFWRFGIWFPKKVSTSIDVEFSGEVGEEAGSWKGGTIGCGWDLRPDETPEQCLDRMQRERKFER